MAGTHEGGLKAAAKNKALNPDFYRINGSKGGKAGNPATKGFAHPDRRAFASEAGKKGGAISRLKPKIEMED